MTYVLKCENLNFKFTRRRKMPLAYGIGGLISVPQGAVKGKGVPPASFKGDLGQIYIDTTASDAEAVYIYDGNSWVQSQVTLSTDDTFANASNETTSSSLAIKNYVDAAVQLATVTVSSAELLALAATPKELVAAPGAGNFIQFLSAQLVLDYNSAAYVESGDNFAIRYTDGTGVIVSDAIETTGFIDQTADTITNAIPIADAIVAATGAVDQALVLHNTGSEITTGDSPVYVTIAYRIISSGL